MNKFVVSTLLLFALMTAPAFATPMSDMAGMSAMAVSSEFSFLAGMVPHHQQAVQDAQLALTRSKRPEVRRLAREIVYTQKLEITQMNTWLDEWYPAEDRTPVVKAMNQEMVAMNMPNLESFSGAAFDKAFLEGMVMHHQMGVEMVNSLLDQGLVKHREVRALAQGIRSAQEAEIAEMRGYLRKLPKA